MRRTKLMIMGLIAMFLLASRQASIVSAQATEPFMVQPGDTWAALAIRFNTTESTLKTLNPHMNEVRQPTIGRALTLPEDSTERSGRLLRAHEGGLVQIAARNGVSPWALADLNGLKSPYRPTFYKPLFLPGEGIVRDLPIGLTAMELSKFPPSPGQAIGLRGTLVADSGAESVNAVLDGLPFAVATASHQFVGVVGTGAFFDGGEPELTIRFDDRPVWSQPVAFADGEWEYQELTLTGEAAQIDQQARDDERARLREIWSQITPVPSWQSPFQTPIVDYLQITAGYGARRSYNGGPYLTYHEGVDFSAYAGIPVVAPAAGTVVLAERLYVRGGAVILDHGLGVFTGYYHLSEVHAAVGQQVRPGDFLGEVGTTGLSTGNHLHWDLLVNGIWVDAAAWQNQGLDCWLLEGLGEGCIAPAPAP